MTSTSGSPFPPGETQRVTQSLLADIVGISADAIICVDAEQRITLFNDGAETIFGYRADEVMGKHLGMLLPDRARRAHATHIERFRHAPEHARKMGERREISGLRKNGDEFPAEAAIAKVKMGDSVLFSVVLRDITDQVALHRQLQRAVQARDDMLSVVAHDLRNPVSAVKMLSTALLRHGDIAKLSEEGKEQLRLVREASVQMDRLIQDLLDVARVETGRLGLHARQLAVGELLDDALGTLRPLVEAARITLAVDVPPGLPEIRADPERIAQVLSNLIGNAIKFTAAEGRITVQAAPDRNAVRISVSDTGTGISRDQLPNIFDRFWQSAHDDGPIRSRGAGLGLPIARGIVQAHGGHMWAESEIGKGSTFHFTLPVSPAGDDGQRA